MQVMRKLLLVRELGIMAFAALRVHNEEANLLVLQGTMAKTTSNRPDNNFDVVVGLYK